jgi:hypothetical protein
VNLPLNQSAVFAIVDSTLTDKGPSDILYIGRSKRPTRRIFGGYLGGLGGKAVKRINSILFDDGYIEKAAVTWMISDRPKAAQRELIDKFVQEHGEFPLWNASKKQVKIQKKPEPKKKVKKKPAAPASKTAKPTQRAAKKPKPAKPTRVEQPKPAEPSPAEQTPQTPQ